ncbi:MAG: efflux transporter periplasmic adaptor subunit [Rhodospirillaceae bacterium]|nr:efflux transporter periplasmic adaptor subunit [Rhodospirillaceae bacterium]
MTKPYYIAAAIAGFAILWIASGSLVRNDENKTELSAEERSLLTLSSNLRLVEVLRSTAQLMTRDIRVAGRTEAERHVTLKAETDGKISYVASQKGQLVIEGTPLVKISLDNRPAKVKKSQAVLEKRQLEYQAAVKLSKKAFTSDVALANAKAQLEGAKAELLESELELERTIIVAPFDGVFNDKYVEIGDYVNTGDVIAAIVDLNPMLVIAEVTENNMQQLTLGTTAKVELLNGTKLRGEISYLSSVASKETRTFRVEVIIDNSDQKLIDGMTVTLNLMSKPSTVHQVPSGALTLNKDGIIGVKTVNTDGIVAFKEVNATSSTENNAWVTGLENAANIIIVGQEFVKIGQKVLTTTNLKESENYGNQKTDVSRPHIFSKTNGIVEK